MSADPQKPQAETSPPFIATAPALEALALLDRGLGAREPFVLVTGEPGAGKSMLVQEAIRRWGARVHTRALGATEATAETLFAALLGRFGGTENSTASGPALAQRLLEAIVHAASGGKVVVVVVEDAHAAPPELLLQLANVAEMARRRQCPFEVLLVGSPELSARMNDPALAGLAEKTAATVRLLPLTQHDARHYLLQRAGMDANGSTGLFSRKACRDIHGSTFGIPRAIDALADESARRAAKAGATIISPDHVRSAVQSLRSRRGNAPHTIIPPRAERMNAPGAKERPQPKPAPAPAASQKPAAAAKPAGLANGGSAPAAAKPAAAAPSPRPAAATNHAPPRVEPAKPAPVAASLAPATVEPSPPPPSEQRVKDWVSRFGGSGPVRIGVGHNAPRYEASATLDAAPPPQQPAAPSRILIVDQEPQLPPELVAKINKLTTRKRRRRGSNAMLQGAALALAVLMLVVVLARQAGFGKRLGFDAGSNARSAAAPTVPPLALETRLESTTTTPAPVKATRPSKSSKSRSKSTSKPLAVLTPVPAETLPAAPARATTSAPVPPAVPVREPAASEGPAVSGQKYSIVAGSFTNSDMAKAEKDHLARLTAYRVWVSKTKVNGVRTYELMVGRFDTMAHAWDAGQFLLRRGLIRDANVRPLSEREAR